MALLYSDIQSEIKRRGARDQGGTQFDTAAKILANTSLYRVSREALWRPLRRKSSFDTSGEYTTGTVTATLDSKTVTGASTSWISAGIHIGQRISISGSSLPFIITAVSSATSLTVDRAYDGTTASSLTYTIYGREEYNLPIQCGRVGFIWHEQFGYPYVMGYITDRAFYLHGTPITTGNVPTLYRMWGQDDVLQQPIAASVMSISSSATADTSKSVTVFGTVSGYPDFETITTNGSDGTTVVAGTKSFTKVERISKSASTTGRVTVTSNSANVTVAVLPVGDSTDRIQYKKMQLFPLPTDVFPVQVQYYKDPWFLINDNDVHELGGDFDEAIICLAVAKLKAESSQKEAADWYALYKDEIRSLRKTNADKLDYFPFLERPHGRSDAMRVHPQLAYSQISGMFGPSGWPQAW